MNARPVHYIDHSPDRLDKIPHRYDVVELKYDGIWGRCVIGNNLAIIYSKTGNEKGRFTVDYDGPTTVLIGEYLIGTAWAKNNARIPHGSFLAFDCVRSAGVDIGEWPQYRRMKEAHDLGCGGFLSDNDWYYSASNLLPMAGTVANAWEAVIRYNGEGLVLKNSQAPYGTPHIRIKRVFEVDYVCTGFEPGGGKYKGCGVASVHGGLFINGRLRQVVRAGGLTDERRRDFWQHPERYIGRVFKATGKGLFDSGALRHPVFVDWHADKRAIDCKL